MLKKSNLEFMSSTPSEYDAMLETYVKEIEEYNTYCKFYRFYAQKIDLPPTPISLKSNYINYSPSSSSKNFPQNPQLPLRSNSTKVNSSNSLGDFKSNSLKKIPSHQ
ncbi:18190_t:CDS:1, partial [Racocetra fulgida]